MKNGYLLFLLPLISNQSFAQQQGDSLYRIDTTISIHAVYNDRDLHINNIATVSPYHLQFAMSNDSNTENFFVNTDLQFHYETAKLFQQPIDTTYLFSSLLFTNSNDMIVAGHSSYRKLDGYWVTKANFISCVDQNDSLLWSKSWPNQEPNIIRSPVQLLQFNDGRILFSIRYFSYNPEKSFAELICLDDNGELLWEKREKDDGGTLKGFIDWTGKQAYYAGSSGYVFKIDEAGNVKWSRQFSYQFPYRFKSIIPANDSELAITSDYGMDLLKLDTNGNFKWHLVIEDPEKGWQSYYPVGICSLADSGFLETILMISSEDDTPDYYAYFISSLDKNGNFERTKNCSFYLGDIVSCNGEAVVQGDTSISIFSKNAAQGCTGFTNVPDWSGKFDMLNSIIKSDLLNDNLSIQTGYFPVLHSVSIQFDTACFQTTSVFVGATDTVNTVDTTGSNGGSDSTSAVSFDSMNFHFSIYPNPAHDWLYLKPDPSLKGETKITFINLLGQVVETATCEDSKATAINLEEIPAGVYLLRLKNQNLSQETKIVVQ